MRASQNPKAKNSKITTPHSKITSPHAQREPEDNTRPQGDDPTPEQIAQRSAEVRLRWSARVKKKRHLRAPVQWSVPQVPVAEIDTRSSN